VFFDKDGAPRSVADVYERFAAKIDAKVRGHGALPSPVARPAPAALSAFASSPVDASHARMAYMLLAELGG
jgi:hypothetical protein